MFRRGRQKRRSIKKKRSQSAPAIIVRSPVKKNKRKQWTNERMVAAMEAVETGKSGINRAGIKYNIQAEQRSDLMKPQECLQVFRPPFADRCGVI